MTKIKHLKVVVAHSAEDFQESLIKQVDNIQCGGLEVKINNPHLMAAPPDPLVARYTLYYVAVVEGSTNVNS